VNYSEYLQIVIEKMEVKLVTTSKKDPRHNNIKRYLNYCKKIKDKRKNPLITNDLCPQLLNYPIYYFWVEQLEFHFPVPPPKPINMRARL